MTRRLVNPKSKRKREKERKRGRVLGHGVREIPVKRQSTLHFVPVSGESVTGDVVFRRSGWPRHRMVNIVHLHYNLVLICPLFKNIQYFCEPLHTALLLPPSE